MEKALSCIKAPDYLVAKADAIFIQQADVDHANLDAVESAELLDECYAEQGQILDDIQASPTPEVAESCLERLEGVEEKLSHCSRIALKENGSSEELCRVVDSNLVTESLCQKIAGADVVTPTVNPQEAGDWVMAVIKVGQTLGIW